MSKQAKLYRQIAADYDRMALVLRDRALSNMYLEFAQQWRDAALENHSAPPTAGIESDPVKEPDLV